MFNVFTSVYIFVYTQTLVNIGDLSVTIPLHLSGLVMVVALAFVYCP